MRSAPQPRAQAPLLQDRLRATGIFFLVLGVYLFTYAGAFKSNDERAYFAGMDSFVKRGEFTANQIYWDYTAVGMLTTSGDMVPNYEPGQMVAPVPFYLWGRALGAGVQGALFFNPVVLSAAAALLYLIFVELRFNRRTGLLGALVFAFATLAWPYSRTFFREPLTTLAYLLAFYALLRYRPPSVRRWIWPALAGFGLGLAIVTKLISVGVIPGLALLAFGYEWRRPADPGRALWRSRLLMILAAAVPFAILLLLYQVYNWMTLSGVETFSRNLIEYTTNPQLSQTVPMRMLRAFVGITISPYKGLFWYCPVLLLGLIAAPRFVRQHRWEGWASLLIVAAHVAGYSRYNYWSGGVAWGMRYLLPIVPFLVLLAAPVWERLAGVQLNAKAPREESARNSSEPPGKAWWLRVLVVASWILIVVSLFIQVLGVSIDLVTWEVKWLLDNIPIWGGLGQAIEGLMLRPEHSPVLGHLRLLLAGQPLDFAWLQQRPQGAVAVLPGGLALSLALVLVGAVALVAIWRRPGIARALGWGTAVVMLAGASALLLIYRQGDARYDKYDVDRFLRPMMAELEAARCSPSTASLRGPAQGAPPDAAHAANARGWLQCQDVFLMPDPALTDYFLNYLAAPLPWYSLEAQPVDEALAGRLISRYDRIYLGRDRNAEADDREERRDWERWLTGHAYKLGEQRFGDWARLIAFSAAGQVAERVEAAQSLGELTLVEARLGVEGSLGSTQPTQDGEVRGRPGGVLQISLDWRADRKPEANYTVFLQLLGEDGQVKAQSDRWPGDGLHPTAALEPGQIVTDNVALALDVPPGVYRLIAGLYRGDVEGAPRLTGPGGDYVKLATVVVEP